MATQKAVNRCGMVSCTPVVLGSKKLDLKNAVPVYTIST